MKRNYITPEIEKVYFSSVSVCSASEYNSGSEEYNEGNLQW